MSATESQLRAMKKYYQKCNGEKQKANVKKWREENREAYLEQARESARRYYYKKKQEKLDKEIEDLKNMISVN
jgi:N-glycosylase/DNA lyase